MLLEAEAIAKTLAIVSQNISTDNVHEALQFVLAQNYLDIEVSIGNNESSKVMFIDFHNIVSKLEVMCSVVKNLFNRTHLIRTVARKNLPPFCWVNCFNYSW
ncbi:hypothetical protein [cyanobacterium endosymbiont of Rhopalodia gibberula]|uniref:hypothetical protein n=1 Tax=cyanobacterium endosymbiont of Rhopalodia gibberula TaxID=1763363 RepID=UPI000E65DE3D|nr:hypothetical protein [cyanobacterium endosymbiont of Rhopalodia gibberula]